MYVEGYASDEINHYIQTCFGGDSTFADLFRRVALQQESLYTLLQYLGCAPSNKEFWSTTKLLFNTLNSDNYFCELIRIGSHLIYATMVEMVTLHRPDTYNWLMADTKKPEDKLRQLVTNTVSDNRKEQR